MAENTAPSQAADPVHVEDEIVRMLAQILYTEPEAVDRQALFTDLGLDSILAVEFCALLENEMGITVPAATVYNLRTPHDFAHHLAVSSGSLEK